MIKKNSKKVVSLAIAIIMVMTTFVAIPGFTDNGKAYGATKKMTITFNPNGGKLINFSHTISGKKVNTTMKSKKAIKGNTYGTLSRVARTGYTFKGWDIKKSKARKITSKSKVLSSGSHSLYAIWSPNVYTLKFNPTGGTLKTTSKKVTYNGKYGTLPIPTRAGYVFQGWYTTSKWPETRKTSGSTYKYSKSTTLYALWSLSATTSKSLIGKSVAEVKKICPQMIVFDDDDFYDGYSTKEISRTSTKVAAETEYVTPYLEFLVFSGGYCVEIYTDVQGLFGGNVAKTTLIGRGMEILKVDKEDGINYVVWVDSNRLAIAIESYLRVPENTVVYDRYNEAVVYQEQPAV